MKTIIVREPGGPNVLELIDTPLPEPGPHQVRLRVTAASLNPIDLSARAGRLTAAGLMPPMPEYGLGWDVAGHVDSTGPGAVRFQAGAAATLPLNALTADRALDLAGLAPGQTLLVTGASGGVGGFVLELAAIRELRTVALARPHDADRYVPWARRRYSPRLRISARPCAGSFRAAWTP